MLARLSVFRGGFGADAARAVTGAALPCWARWSTSRCCARTARLALHPMLQALAAAKLDDEGADAKAAAHAAHAAYFHRLLHGAQAASAQGHALPLAAIETEFENCRHAWAVTVASGHVDGDRHSCAPWRWRARGHTRCTSSARSRTWHSRPSGWATTTRRCA